MLGRFTPPGPTSAPRTCVVCAQPLDWRVALTPRPGAAACAPEPYPLCPAFDCRAAFEQGRGMPDAEFQRHLQWRGQMLRASRARARLQQDRSEAENHEAAALFAAIAPRAAPASPADLRLTAPSGHRPSRPLPARRRRAHAAHLDAIIAEAFDAAASPKPTDRHAALAPPAPGQNPGAADQRLPARLCGACGGGCCANGGDLAYLSVETIRRVIAANPGLDPAQLRATYLGCLDQRTLSNSCIHHTRDGCSLPRALRSDTCNDFACAALRRLQDGLEADPPVRRVIVLRRRQNLWNQTNLALNNDVVGAAILTEAATMRVPLPRRNAGACGEMGDRAS